MKAKRLPSSSIVPSGEGKREGIRARKRTHAAPYVAKTSPKIETCIGRNVNPKLLPPAYNDKHGGARTEPSAGAAKNFIYAGGRPAGAVGEAAVC